MKRKHIKTLAAIFARPVSSNVQWRDVEALFKALGATIEECEGSRVAVILFGQVQVYHRPHPSRNTDKGAVASIRRWLETNDTTPESIKEQTDDEQSNDD
ncbi:MAG TPA: type II toxin-antitoxin system HicA family toxin [Agitococcus sp.]|uniref:type II toxin-antitoxin system HicA family toxin n=1 Tax=uncultured Agitococcus sp. TaxID=1506599 RepID=UPI00261678FC|nr:type II toxin-antitoxin system HicA family toxin [uncultured Agitococcus sp.]HMV61573.1 type II toxin-antitoxin system HicA family toxin [Agitococcus sp.]HMY01306.1 type II toxin-antitoxin system HicA family toxin [Agitococcus sp.]HMY29042.1 type II toxin-antitoxin system HicA family toxin [Agitococcus sp.]HMY81818.1 type II toxin-antitoxin system HicA family toxin [Agitococcus sp.]HNA22318.1 type II toxin-antitoxin system HicA family toxin [Agitococcus sp.]